jgi:hypothetical protein
MPSTSNESSRLLAELEAAKGRFGPGHESRITKLLTQLSHLPVDDPYELIRFHECLLFLRAFPCSPAQVKKVERLLNTFHDRVERICAAGADMSVFDDFDTSGIAGTTMQDTLSFDVARWLVQRIPRNVGIAWDEYWQDYESERARGNTLPRFIPLLEEDADVEANIPWMRWSAAARGRESALAWLLKQFALLPLPGRQKSELYDSLRLPLRWKLQNLKLTRTRNWTHPRRWFFHGGPLIQRSEVSLAQELARPAPALKKLSLRDGEKVMDAIREVMVVRYRELYGTTLGDPHSVVRADLGRGVVIHFWGLPSQRRLPLRAYLAGYTLKNGVPINYIEAIGLFDWMEVGFNTFYTYRQGETAWIYAQALRCIRALSGARCISIYPYQIGQNNDEAIESGAFWFYRKLGFRPGRSDLRKLCQREERRIAANKEYRTTAPTLKRLAEAHMFYETLAQGEGNLQKACEWDTFSVRNIGLKINRRMGREFGGDSRRIREASAKFVARVLGISAARWTPEQKRALENWSLVLALIPDLGGWRTEEKRAVVDVIRAKVGRDEMSYLREMQRHSRLRSALLSFGSARRDRSS